LARCGSSAVRDSPELVAAGIALELRGWKGRAGTAIAQDAATLGFYTDLARELAAQGQLALWAMYLDERLIAFQYGIEHRGCYALLKPAYDETYSRYSPGQLLMAEVLRDGIARKLDRLTFSARTCPGNRTGSRSLVPGLVVCLSRQPYGKLLRPEVSPRSQASPMDMEFHMNRARLIPGYPHTVSVHVAGSRQGPAPAAVRRW
jgi:hypothetical protein